MGLSAQRAPPPLYKQRLFCASPPVPVRTFWHRVRWCLAVWGGGEVVSGGVHQIGRLAHTPSSADVCDGVVHSAGRTAAAHERDAPRGPSARRASRDCAQYICSGSPHGPRASRARRVCLAAPGPPCRSPGPIRIPRGPAGHGGLGGWGWGLSRGARGGALESSAKRGVRGGGWAQTISVLRRFVVRAGAGAGAGGRAPPHVACRGALFRSEWAGLRPHAMGHRSCLRSEQRDVWPPFTRDGGREGAVRAWEGPCPRDASEGGGTPPPLQGAQSMPSHCPPDAKCQPQWHL